VPYIVITEIDNVPEHHLDGGGGTAHASVQIACYHTSRGAARALSDLVFASLDSRVTAAMGDDSLVVEQVLMERRFPMDTDPDDASQQGSFKDVCEFAFSYAESETP
jgi:hypothetical protein